MSLRYTYNFHKSNHGSKTEKKKISNCECTGIEKKKLELSISSVVAI